MKKFLTVVALLALLVSSAFAGATTITKEKALSDYPALLTPGSINALSTFATDLTVIGNSAIVEATSTGAINALVSLKTDFGIIGLTSAPAANTNTAYANMNDISVTLPANVFGIYYSTSGSDMAIGGSLVFGNNSASFENKRYIENPMGQDKANTGTTYAGISLNVDMPKSGMAFALGCRLSGNSYSFMDYNNVDPAYLRSDLKTDNSLMAFDLTGRIAIGEMFNLVPFGNFTIGSQTTTYSLETNNASPKEADTTTTLNNTGWTAGSLIGKDIKAGSSLTIKLASGVEVMGSGSATVKATDTVTTTYNAASYTDLDITVPFYVAVEGKLNDTWAIVGGAKMTVLSMNSHTDKVNNDLSGTNFVNNDNTGTFAMKPGVSIGLGVTGTIGDLKIDFRLDPTVLLSGTYVLSGVTKSLNYGVALSYGWK